MEYNDAHRVVLVERTREGPVIHFANGASALYPHELLWRMMESTPRQLPAEDELDIDDMSQYR